MRALSIIVVAHVIFGFATPIQKRAVDYFNPSDGGGSMLNNGLSNLSNDIVQHR
jgi:hypothetical protein